MAQCEKCGSTIIEGATFCTNCGAPAPANNIPNNNPVNPFNNSVNQPAMQPDMQPTMQPGMAPGMQPAPNNMQPNMASTIPDALNDQTPKKEKKKFLIPVIAMSAISVICLAVGIAGIVIGTSSNNSGGGTSGSGGTSGGGSSVVTPPDTNGGGGTATGTQIQVGKYVITLPDDFDYQTKTDYIAIAPSSQPTWLAEIEYTEEATYAQLESLVEEIIANGETEMTGITATGSYLEVDGTKYLCLEMREPSTNRNATAVIAKAGLYALMATVINQDDSKPATENVKTVASILGTAKQKKDLNKSAYGNTSEQEIQSLQTKILQNANNK